MLSRSRYWIKRITDFGIVYFYDDNLKYQAIHIDYYLRYCCD